MSPFANFEGTGSWGIDGPQPDRSPNRHPSVKISPRDFVVEGWWSCAWMPVGHGFLKLVSLLGATFIILVFGWYGTSRST